MDRRITCPVCSKTLVKGQIAYECSCGYAIQHKFTNWWGGEIKRDFEGSNKMLLKKDAKTKGGKTK